MNKNPPGFPGEFIMAGRVKPSSECLQRLARGDLQERGCQSIQRKEFHCGIDESACPLVDLLDTP